MPDIQTPDTPAIDRKSRGARKTLAGLLAAMLLLTLGPAPVALGAGGPRTVTVFGGACDFFGANVPADEDTVEAHVDDRFVLRGDGTGVVTVGIVFLECATMKVNGEEGPPMDYFVLMTELADGVGSYDILEISNSKAWQSAMKHVDKPSERTARLDVAFPGVAGVSLAYGEVSWKDTWVRARAMPAAGAALPDVPSPSHHWGAGKFGIVHGNHSNEFERFGAATLHFEASPNSLFETLLGTTDLVIAGLEGRYDSTAVFNTPAAW